MAKEDVLISSENSYGLVAFIFGVFSILLAPALDLFIFYGPVAGTILGILGIIFSVKQRSVSKNKWSVWGLWLSIVGVVINVAVFVLLIKFIIPVILPKITEIQQQIMSAVAA